MMYKHKNGCVFHKLSEEHLWRLLELKMESWPTTHKVAMINEADQLDWFNSIPKDALYMICSINTKEGWEEVGLLTLNSIDNIARTAMIGGSIFLKWRATEWSKRAWEAGTDFAFEMLNLHRLDAEVLEYNTAALKMDIEIGYTVEGRRRSCVYKCGRYYDSLVLGYLREEWQKSARVTNLKICNTNFKEPTKDIASRVIDRTKPPAKNKMTFAERVGTVLEKTHQPVIPPTHPNPE